MTLAEERIVLRLAQSEPARLLSLLAGCLAPQVEPVVRREPIETERRAGEDPFLITEDEFSYRARGMSLGEQKVLRARVNAARSHKAGYLDEARRYRQQADRLERKLQ